MNNKSGCFAVIGIIGFISAIITISSFMTGNQEASDYYNDLNEVVDEVINEESNSSESVSASQDEDSDKNVEPHIIVNNTYPETNIIYKDEDTEVILFDSLRKNEDEVKLSPNNERVLVCDRNLIHIKDVDAKNYYTIKYNPYTSSNLTWITDDKIRITVENIYGHTQIGTFMVTRGIYELILDKYNTLVDVQVYNADKQ